MASETVRLHASDPPAGTLADRLAVEDLLIRYCTAIDEHDWALMDTVFQPDALWDSTSAGGLAGPYQTIRAPLVEELAHWEMTHHLSNIVVTFHGDTAKAKSYTHAWLARIGPEGPMQPRLMGAAYHDDLVRTPEGWRIQTRIEHLRWTHGDAPRTG